MAITINGNGTITGISTGGLPDGIVDTDMLASGAAAGSKLGTGSILQVQQTHYSDRVSNSTASGAEWAPSQLNCAITPSASSNKVLITAKVAVGFSISGRRVFFKAFRDSTQIAKGDTASDNTTLASSAVDIRYDDVVEDIFFQYLDSPNTTSQVTYSFRFTHSQTADGTIYINRAHTIVNRVQDGFPSSNVTLMEIAA